jgi:disulfide bond formation protein DsbB
MLNNLSLKEIYLGLIIVCTMLVSSAFTIEYVLKLKPCALCNYQRYTYLIVIVIASIGMILKSTYVQRIFLYCCVIVISIGALIAFYHVGIEQHIFSESVLCSPDEKYQSILTVEDVKNQIYENNHVSCSQISFKFIGISIAGWNGILSVIIVMWLLRYLHKIKT